MKLCDIGNTNFSFEDGTKYPTDGFNPASVQEEVYFISVNPYWEKRLAFEPMWTNLREFTDFSRYYESMGIDRVMCCEAVDNALIVDAGSAITVDLIRNGHHQGGFIYPGFEAMRKSYKNISSRLEVSLNFDIDLATMPKNTQDAISFGVIAPLVSYIRALAEKLPIIITGGDAQRLEHFLPCASVDEGLVFKGMKKIIKDMKC